jgi:LysR family transcriptional regulator for metE and metH
LDSANKILKEIEQVEDSIRKHVNGDKGLVRLATECYACYHWLPTLMINYKKSFPNIEVEIFPGTTPNPSELILNGELDLAITSNPDDNPALVYSELFRDDMVAVVSKNHPWVKEEYVTAQHFIDQNVFIHSYPLESVSLFKQLLIPDGVKPKKVMPIQVMDAALQMVKADLGVQVMSRWVVDPYLKDDELRIVPVTKKGLYRTWYAVHLKTDTTARYIEHFIDHLQCNVGSVCVWDAKQEV